ncbi:MAG: phosphoserine phosphatase SerB [Zoogloeaceae bacterium]|jgi:phosphoserine phosphatase|nr:phosphoserine phosphatase SerB [Zoogloeaceae bacterium]
MCTGDLVLQGEALSADLLEKARAATGGRRVLPGLPQVARLAGATRGAAFDALLPALEAARVDWAFMPAGARLPDYRLIAFDMDSTLITIECIDELADFAGKKSEVAAVTEAAMQGDIDYPESLRRRLALLAGLDARMLARVYAERLRLSPGTRELLAAARDAGLRTVLLSGGFTYFTERLRIELGFDFATSNELEIVGGKMTGRVVGGIVDAEAKAGALRRLKEEQELRREQVIAVGDGANDLRMMAEAGLSVAYHAKPATRAKADVALNFCGLDGLLRLFV